MAAIHDIVDGAIPAFGSFPKNFDHAAHGVESGLAKFVRIWDSVFDVRN